jgi:hypothetical protein
MSRRAVTLFGDAHQSGHLSERSSVALQNVRDLLPEVDKVLGDKRCEGDVLLVSVLVDDSSSIRAVRNGIDAVIRGHNRLIDVAQRSRTHVLFHTRYFSAGSLTAYRDADEAVRLSTENYRAGTPRTPLYDSSLLMLGSVVAQATDLAQAGCQVRTFTLILTDGENNTGKTTADDVRFLTTDMLEFASNHIIAGMGIGNPTVFRRVFTSMGIPRRWILTARSTDAEIEAVFNQIERAIAIAASSAAGFRQLSTGSPD